MPSTITYTATLEAQADGKPEGILVKLTCYFADLLNTLRGKVKLGIITNGFTKLQQVRLERTEFRDHFDVLIISEQVGVAKPHPDIFEYALSVMGHPSREQVLMVGDNPDSDILGGLNAGLHTCWVNANNRPEPMNIKPHYQVSSLSELESLLVQL
jgi:5'-nucleotidase